MGQCRSRLKLSQNFERRWSILICMFTIDSFVWVKMASPRGCYTERLDCKSSKSEKRRLWLFPGVCSGVPEENSGKAPGNSWYPLTRNYYENNSLRLIFPNFPEGSHLQNLREKKDFFKELRMKFVIFQK